MTDVSDRLHETLRLSIRRSIYGIVKVLALYWEDAHHGYHDEARAVAAMFKNSFQYPSETYAIPSSNGYSRVLGLLSQTFLDIGTAAQDSNVASLLIIHYGGHGDRDDDRHKDQERRSVWAAHIIGEPTLQWFRIQDQFDALNTAGTDVLLILDCCYAAQAARAHEASRARFEILAASAMGVATPPPGNTSFTSILIRETLELLKSEDSVVVRDLCSRLTHRKAQLHATPVHVAPEAGQRPIKLQPLSHIARTELTKNDFEADTMSFLHLLIEVDGELSTFHADEIARWLGADTPQIVSKLVFQTTAHISTAIQRMQDEPESIARHLDPASREEITRVWNEVVDLVERYHATEHGEPHQQPSLPNKRRRAHSFLRQLAFCNDSILNTIERNLLQAQGVQNDLIAIDEAIADNAVQALGLVEQFQIRRIICQSEIQHVTGSDQTVPRAHANETGAVIEGKEYGPYLDPAELPSLVERVRLLAELLRTPESTGFRSLKCLGWEHFHLENKFALYFEIPSGYNSRNNNYETLYSVIRNVKSPLRPSMDDRIAIALGMATAIQKWHSVGWVHQGISSHNIIFFRSEITGHIDYLHPFLHGFDFARPDSDSSIGRALDDVAFNVYRHPHRQGTARKGHRKVHDLYSLGVVMLEIGLWQTAASMLDRKREYQPFEIQKVLQNACSDRLAHYAGVSYQSAVTTGLDSMFEVGVDNETGSNLARAFEVKVMQMIRRGISLL
ncbi:hypothetical protein SCUP234_05110 [Seiridium cupressi]